MLAAVRWGRVLLGVGVGVLTLALSSLGIWLALSAVDAADPVGAATTFGILCGFAAAGTVAGRGVVASAWFHGAIAALGVALPVVVTAVRGGSAGPTGPVLLLAGFAIVIGGVTGHFAGRR